MKKTAKCPYCSKQVPISKKGTIGSHLQSTGLKCIGIGFNAKQAKIVTDRRDQAAHQRASHVSKTNYA